MLVTNVIHCFLTLKPIDHVVSFIYVKIVPWGVSDKIEFSTLDGCKGHQKVKYAVALYQNESLKEYIVHGKFHNCFKKCTIYALSLLLY